METFRGRVQGNVIVLSEGVRLEEGTPVEVRIISALPRAPVRTSAEAAFKKRLLEQGLLSDVSGKPSKDVVTDRQPITVVGKHLSDLIIEERR